MTKIEVLIAKFLSNPESLRFVEIEKIFSTLGLVKKQGRGSHTKYALGKEWETFSLHNGDVKPYQKRKALKLLQRLKLI